MILCRSSVTEAFYFSRSLGKSSQRNLLERLSSFVLANSTGAVRANRGVELISLPFDEEEEAWFEEYLEKGNGRTLFGASDTLMMRAQLTGRPNAILRYGKNMTGCKIDGVNWAILNASVLNGSRSADSLTTAFTV